MATYIKKTVQWKRGIIVLYAGTPLDASGKPVNDATAVGILAEDLHAPDTEAKVLTAGAWDEDAHTGSGIVISDAVKLKLTGITFSGPLRNTATALKAGLVKQGVNVAAASGSPTKANFNSLLSALKNAGIIAPDEFSSLSVLAVPTPAKMPTAETAANSGHATLTISDDNVITIALNCEVLIWRTRTTAAAGAHTNGSDSASGPGSRPLWASNSRTIPEPAPRWPAEMPLRRPISA